MPLNEQDRMMMLQLLARAISRLRSWFTPSVKQPKYEIDNRHAALESLEPRMVLTTLSYTVDNPAAYLAANPGGLQDGKIDLAVRVSSVSGSPVLQLVDVDKAAGGQVVGTAPFTPGNPIIVDVTGWSTTVDGKTEEFPELLTIDLANSTGLAIPAVPLTVTLSGIKGTLVPLLQDDAIQINPSSVNAYSPASLDVTLNDGDKLSVMGKLAASGDVTLKGNESDLEVTAAGSIVTTGNISLTTTAALTTQGDADSLDALAMLASTITVNGGSLSGNDITLGTSISANVTISSTTLRDGQFNVGGVLATSSSTIVVDGNSQINATGNLTLGAVSSITTSVVRGTQDDGDSSDDDRKEDAAIAASVVTSSVGVRLSDTANLTAGGSANITSSNVVNVTTTADGSLSNGSSGSSQGGGTLATSTVYGDTEVLIEDTVTIASVGTLTINSTSNRNVTTTSTSTPKGAADDGDASTKTSGQTALANNNASTSDGALTLAAAISVNTVFGETRALVTGGSLSSSTGSILIGTTANHNIQTLADGTVSTGQSGTGVGVAAAIGLAGPTDPNGATGLRSTARVSGNVALNASSVSIQSTAPQNNFKTQAISGPSGPSKDQDGKDTGSDVGIAGALAIGVTIVKSNAEIAPGANVTTNGANVNINATSNTLSDVQALPKEHPVSGKSLGLGAGVAVNITDMQTLATLANNASLSGAHDLSISSNSVNSMSTLGKAGAAGGTAIAAAVAFELGHNDTQAVIGTGGNLSVTGQTTLATSHTGNSSAKAEGDAEGGTDAAIGAAVSISLLEDKTESLLNRNLSADKAINITSSNNSTTNSNAKASAQGESDSGSQDDANSQASAQRGAADSQAASRGARSSTDATSTPDASTSEGSVTVAAAVALNLARSTTRSAIASNLSVSAGGALTQKSTDQTVAGAVADGSATDTETGVGAAVAINAATANNRAVIGSNAVVTADGITIEANKAVGNSQFDASATSGVGASDVGIAGSLAINMGRVDTRASVESGAVLNLVDGSDSGTAVGDLKVIAGSSTNNTSAASATAKANGDAGVGASVAFNITDHDTRAIIDNNANINGAGNVTVTAVSQHPITTTATGGAAGGTAITPVATATLAFPTTEARIGSSLAGNMTTTGSVTISAAHTGDITSNAVGKTNGTDAAIGASLGFTYAKEDVSATLERNLTSGGSLSVLSSIDAAHPTQATASASGAKGEDTNQGGTVQNKNDQLRTTSNSKSKNFSNSDSGDTKKATASTNDKDGNTSDLSVAAAISVNIIEASTRAKLADGLNVQADGPVKISSTQDIDATTNADGTASKGDIGIGAAVAINVVDIDNEAKIGVSNVTADGVTIEAVMLSPAPGQSETSTFSAVAKSGAGGKDVGVAGSLAINHIETRTTAKLDEEGGINLVDGGDLFSNVGPVSINAQTLTSSTAEALPDVIGGGASGDVGIGASVALNILYLDTTAEADNGAAITGQPSKLTIDAIGDHTTTTNAVNGAAAGDVGIGGAVSIVISKSHTTSRLGLAAGLTTSTGDVSITANHDNHLTTQVSSAASGGDAAIAASVGVVLVEDTVDATLERNVQSGQNVTVKAKTNTQSTLNVKASAGGGDEGDQGETADDQASQQANQPNTTSGGNNTLPKTQDNADSANSKSDDESSNSGSDVGVAASVAINALSIKNIARILGGADVTAAGDILVSADSHVISTSEADSSAIALDGNVGVGAAVALNWVSLTNKAQVESDSVLSGNHVTIEAVTTDNQTNDYLATAFAVAGNTGDAGVAGVVAINVVDADTTAMITDGATVNATGNVTITSEHMMRAQAGAIAGAGSGNVGIAAAVAINVLGLNETGEQGGSQTLASVGDPTTAGPGATINAGGDVQVKATYSLGMFPTLNLSATLNDPNGADLDDINEEVLSVAISGGGSTGDFAAAGSAGINLLESTTHAAIDRSANVTAGSLHLDATDTTNINSLAGSLGVSAGGVGLGLGLDLNIIHKDTQATIGRSADVQAGQSATLTTNSNETLTSVAATVGVGNSVGGAGTAVVQVVETTTISGIEDAAISTDAASLTAKGVSITADGNLKTRLISGAVGVGGSAGVGASNTTLVHNDQVEANIGDYAHVNSQGNATLSATSTEEVLSIAAAAGAAGTAGVAGAAVVNTLNETTKATIGDRTILSIGNGLAAGNPNLMVAAFDETDVVSVGGSLAAGGSGGVGVGVDAANFNKLTVAQVGSDVTASIEGNLLVTADSKEDVTSVAAGLSVGGTGAVTLDASVHVGTITTRAFIGDDPNDLVNSLGAGDVHAEGSIMVAADDQNELDKVVGVLAAAGTGALAGGAAVTTLTKNTEAFIGQAAKVTADGRHQAIDARTGKYVITYVTPSTTATTGVESNNSATRQQSVKSLSANGEVGMPQLGSVDMNQDSKNDEASDPSLKQQRTLTLELQPNFRGVAVVATNRDDIENYSVSAAMAGGASVGVSAGVNVLNVNTQAYTGIDSKINDDQQNADTNQSVLISASSDLAHVAFAGAVAVGAQAGVAPAADITVLNGSTKATLGWDAKNQFSAAASAKAKKDVSVKADASEDILLVGIGVGGGAAAGIGAGVDVLVFKNQTQALVGSGANVQAQGNIVVDANDESDIDIISGGGGGGIVGAGAGVGVMSISKDTIAYVDTNANLTALGKSAAAPGVMTGALNQNETDIARAGAHGVIVQATSREDILHMAIAVAGGYVAVAGGVAVTMVDSDTQAEIASGAQINQQAIGTADPTQSVYVNAGNVVNSLSFAGAVGGGLGAAAGAISFGTLKNDTSAKIGDSAVVKAADDVEVNAVGLKNIDDYTISGAGGGVAVAAAVSMWSIGSPLRQTYANESGKQADGAVGNNDDKNMRADQDTANQSQNTRDQLSSQLQSFKGHPQNPKANSSRLSGITQGAALNLNSNAPSATNILDALGSASAPSGTSAVIGDFAVVTAGNLVDSDINVNALEKVDVNITVGGVAIGLGGAGASVSVVSTATNVSTYSGGTLSAGGDIDVSATLDQDVKPDSFVGSGGFVGLGAAVVDISDTSTVQAALGSVSAAKSVSVRAVADQQLGLSTDQFSVAAAAAGASFTTLNAKGSVGATVLGGAQIGQQPGQTVGSLLVSSDSTINAHNSTTAIVAGGVAVSANFAKATVAPVVSSNIGANANIKVAGAATVEAIAAHDVTTDVFTLTGGAVSIGASISTAELSGSVTTNVANGAAIRASQISLDARLNHDGTNPTGDSAIANAQAPSPAPSILSGSGTNATANANTSVLVSTGDNSQLTSTSGNISVRAAGSHDAKAEGLAMSLGLAAAAGITIVNATANGGTQVDVKGGLDSAAALDVEARAKNKASANGEAASAAGLFGASGVNATATASPTVLSSVDSDDFTKAAGAFSLQSHANNQATATGSGGAFGGAAGIGKIDTVSTTSGKTRTYLKGQTNVDSFNMKSDGTNVASATDTSAAGGVGASGASVTAAVNNQAETSSEVAGHVRVNSTTDIQSVATTTSTAHANTVAVSGLMSDGGGVSTVTSKPKVTALVNGGSITAPTKLNIVANDLSNVKSESGALAGSLGASLGSSTSTNTVAANVEAGIIHGLHEANNVNIHAIELGNHSADADGKVGGGFTVAGGVATTDVKNSVRAHVSNDVLINPNVPGSGDVVVNADDTSNVTNTVDQLAIGGGADGAAASYVSVKNKVDSHIDGLAVVSTSGNVKVTADEVVDVNNTAVGISGGIAGFSGNVAVNTLASETNAFISDKSTITADDSVLVAANTHDTVNSSSKGVAAGAFGSGGTTMINTFDNITRARVDDSTKVYARGNGIALTVPTWDSTGTQTNVPLKGLGVIAHTQEDADDPDGNGPLPAAQIQAFNAAGGLGGHASINAMNIVHDRTEAFVAKSEVNTVDKPGNQVLIHAATDTPMRIHADGAAGGAESSGGVSTRNTLANVTRAFVSNVNENGDGLVPVTTKVFGQDLQVSAQSHEKITLDTQGVTGGGFSLAGSISIAELANKIEAFTHDSQLASSGDLAILAGDNSSISGKVNTVSAGGLAGGAAITFNTISNNVKSQVIGGQLFADDVLDIKSTTSETINTQSNSLGAGLAGLAGTVALNVIESTTEANVLKGDSAAQINQDVPAMSGLTMQQNVHVVATDDANITNTQGATGAGGVGVGASVEFGSIRNRTVATVGPESSIYATQDVDIQADTSRKLDSEITAYAGGVLGLAGAVSFLSLGIPDPNDLTVIVEEFAKAGQNGGDNLQQQTDKPSQTEDVSSNIQDKPGAPGTAIAADAAARVNQLSDSTVQGTMQSAKTDRITGALIVDAPTTAEKSHIEAAGNLTIEAHNDYSLTQDIGSTAGGVIGVGASVAVTKVRQSTQAELGKNNALAAGGNININAEDLTSPTPIDISVFGGQGGAIGGTINVADLLVQSNVTTTLDKNSVIEHGEVVAVTSNSATNVDIDGAGISGNLAASDGVVNVTPHIKNSTVTLMDDGAKVGSIRSVAGLRLAATGTSNVENNVSVGAAALGVSVSSGESNTLIEPTVQSHVGNADIKVRGNTFIETLGSFVGNNKVDALNAALIGDGSGVSRFKLDGSIHSQVDDQASIESGDLFIKANQSNLSTTEGVTIGGGLAAGMASEATNTIYIDTLATVGKATITTDDSVKMLVNSNSNATATSQKDELTGFGVGGSKTSVDIQGDVQATMNISSVHAGGPIHLLTDSKAIGSADSLATTKGLLNGNAAKSTVFIDVDTLSEANADLTAQDEIRIESSSQNTADTKSRASTATLLGAKGWSEADSTINSSTRAMAQGDITSQASYIRVQAEDSLSHANAEAVAAGASLGVGISKTTSNAKIAPAAGDNEAQLRARLAGKVHAAGDIAVRAQSLEPATSATTKGISISGAIASAETWSKSTLSPTVRSSIGDASKVTSDAGDIKVEAHNQSRETTASTSAIAGSLAASETSATADATAGGNTVAVVGSSTIEAPKGTVSIQADSSRSTTAQGNGISVGGVVGIGNVQATANSGGNVSTDSIINPGASVTANNLNMSAGEDARGLSYVIGTGGGFISDQGAKATTKVTPNANVTVSQDAKVTLTGDAVLKSVATVEGDAEAEGNSFGAGAVSKSDATVTLTPSAKTTINKNGRIKADHNIDISAQVTPSGVISFAPLFVPKPEADRGTASVQLGDGFSQARSIGGSGSVFYGEQGSTAKVSANPTAQVTIDSPDANQPPTLDAGGDLTLTTRSRSNIDTQTTNEAVGILLAGNGNSLSGSAIDSYSQVTINPDVQLKAGNDLKLDAAARHVASADARASGYGAIGLANSDSYADIDYTTESLVGKGAKLTAGRDLMVGSTTNSKGDSDAYANGGGVGAATNANVSGDDDNSSNDKDVGGAQRGVRIGHKRGETTTEVSSAAELTARKVYLNADIDLTQGQSTGDADSGGAVADAAALSRVELSDKARVNVRTGANITGKELVLLQSAINDLNIDFNVHARSEGVFVDASGYASVNSNNDASVVTEDKALITTHDLQVKALTTGVDYPAYDASKPNLKGDLNTSRSIAFDADAVLTMAPVVLRIGPAGQVIEQSNVTYQTQGNTLVVDDIVNLQPGKALFHTDTVSTPSDVKDAPQGHISSPMMQAALLGNQPIVHGVGPELTFKETLDEVVIENQSPLNLSIGNINVVNKTLTPDVAIETESLDLPYGFPVTFTESFGFDVKHVFGPTSVVITDPVANPGDITLRGLIDNPIGHTEINTANGGVVTTANSRLRTNDLDIQATGVIGTPALPLAVDLVQSASRPVDLDVHTGGDVNLVMRGLVRDASQNQFTFNGGIIDGNNLNVTLAESLLQPKLDPTVSYLVDVSETHPIQVTQVENRFRDDLATLTVLDLGIFGIAEGAAQAIQSSITFTLLEAGGSINVASLPGKTITLAATTNVLASGTLNVTNSGHLSLTEAIGDMRVDNILSQLGDVTLITLAGSVIDADNDTAADVSGHSITINSQNGVGTQANPLDIDSSLAQAGLVQVQAVSGLFLIETAGILNAGLIKTTGALSLKTINGGIVDALNENLINLSGQSITLVAQGNSSSTIGELGDRLEVCTSTPLSSQAGGSIYLFNICGLLKLGPINAVAGSVDIAAAGNIELPAGGAVVAAGSVTLDAGLDLLLEASTQIVAGELLTLKAGQSLTGGPGAMLRSEGLINAPQMKVYGGPASDTFLMKHQWSQTGRGQVELFAGLGNDTLDVAALTDEVFAYGEAGDDLFLINDLVGKHLSGALGNDQVQLKSAAATIDLTRLDRDVLVGIEGLDISGTGRNTLTLNQLAVIGLSDETDTLVVRRTRDDQVDIGSGWTFVGNEITDGTLFKVYQQDRATIKIQAITALVLGRNVFYNRSFFDGNSTDPNAGDDGAIAADKVPLISGTATLANVTNYSRGINGIMIDVFNLPDDIRLTAEDFRFRIGNSDTPASWAVAPNPSSISVRKAAGVSGAHRITLIWPDNVIQKTWLQVTLLANNNTTLESNDTFYFGNAIGDVGDSSGNMIVNATDIAAVVSNQNSFLNPARINSPYDFNHDRLINATDVAIAVSNQTNFLTALRFIRIAPTSGRLVGDKLATPAVSVASQKQFQSSLEEYRKQVDRAFEI